MKTWLSVMYWPRRPWPAEGLHLAQGAGAVAVVERVGRRARPHGHVRVQVCWWGGGEAGLSFIFFSLLLSSVSNWLWQNSRKIVKKKMLTPPFPQKHFTFVKQFILEFEEKLETLIIRSSYHLALALGRFAMTWKVCVFINASWVP